jgi:hypothetical protein
MRLSRFAAALGVAVAVVLGGAAAAGAATPDMAGAQPSQDRVGQVAVSHNHHRVADWGHRHGHRWGHDRRHDHGWRNHWQRHDDRRHDDGRYGDRDRDNGRYGDWDNGRYDDH